MVTSEGAEDFIAKWRNSYNVRFPNLVHGTNFWPEPVQLPSACRSIRQQRAKDPISVLGYTI